MSNQQPTGQPAPARSVQSQAGGSAIPAKRGVCLLVHARDQCPPAKLTESLARNGAAIVSCVDVHTVLAHACRINRGQSIGGEDGAASALPSPGSQPSQPPSRAVVVILVEPRSLSDLPLLADLAEALRRYAPRSTLWFFEDGASKQPLRVVTSEDLSGWMAGAGRAQRAEQNAGHAPTAPKGVAPSVFVPPVRTPLRGASAAAGSGFPGLTTPADRTGGGTLRLRLVEPDESGVRAALHGGSPAGAAAANTVSSLGGPLAGGTPAGGSSLNADELPHVEPEPAPHLLTAEELSMLLGDPEGFGDEPLPEADGSIAANSPQAPHSPSPPGPPAGGSPAA